MAKTSDKELRRRAKVLHLYGLLAHWEEFGSEPWVRQLIEYEECERQRRSLQRRISHAKLGGFKLMADFDWEWQRKSIARR